MQTALDRVVAGVTTFVLDFDGPTTAYVGSTMYETHCSGGLKREGDESQNFGWQEAIERYGAHLASLIKEHEGKQLAWRRRPRIECHKECEYRVTSRLAFI
jgi:hypothetical protein